MSKDCTIQDVFHRFYPSFESTHDISPAQRKAAYHIMNCKTGAFGVNVSVCEDCGCISVHYNSCRDRCCPMCQEFPKEKWVDARREDILSVNDLLIASSTACRATLSLVGIPFFSA